MSPEYGATCGFFPVDDIRSNICATPAARPSASRWSRLCQAQGMYRTKTTPDPLFTDVSSSNSHRSSLRLPDPSGRRTDRAQEVKNGFALSMEKEFSKAGDGGKQIFDLHPSLATSLDKDFGKAGHARRLPVEGRTHDLGHGDVVIAAITSCTNTSNPSVMVGAGLLARKAVAKGLTVKPWSRPRWRRARRCR